MNYNESLEYIHGISWSFCKPGLERIERLCKGLENPQDALKFVHVAGTNGKGSFCSMLTEILIAAGFKVGTFTSPYIRFFNERMQINGEPISDAELAEITTYVRPIADALEDKPTEFELISAVAFEYFKRAGCDIVVLEAGMGGRLDSTNIIKTPYLSVITGIALDHVAYLGDTHEKIAAEKAGIIKAGVPCLFGGTHEGAREVIEKKAESMGSALVSVDYSRLHVKNATLDGADFDFGDWRGMHISLLGLYQPRNACVVLSAVELLRKAGLAISDTAVHTGLEKAKWQARFEILCGEPLTIFDGAHNPEGVTSAVESILHYFGDKKLYVLTGVLRDKDYGYISGKLAEIAERAFTMTPDNPRALPASEYAECLSRHGVAAEAYDTLADAYTAAHNASLADGIPLVCMGSLYTYSELIKLIK